MTRYAVWCHMRAKVSVIIPCLNSPLICRVLEHLDNQTASEVIDEILVVGRDSTGQVKTAAKVRYIDTGSPVGSSEARNIGINNSSNPLLLFLDSDCLPQADCLQKHIEAHEAGHCIVGGGILPSGDNYWSLTYNLALFHEFLSNLPAKRCDYLPTLNLSIQKEVFDQVGVFDENLTRGQDIEWTLRAKKAGRQPCFWPGAVVQHIHYRNSLSHVWDDCARSGYFMRRVRLQNKALLFAPWWLKHRLLILFFSPLIATVVTARIVLKSPSVFLRFWCVLPGLFLAKLAWCWGAAQRPLSP